MEFNNSKQGFNQQKKMKLTKNCPICSRSDAQTQTIIQFLLQKLLAMRKSNRPSADIKQSEKLQKVSFQKMLNSIFAKKYSHLKALSECPHLELKNYFCGTLKCSESILNQLSSQIAWKKAKYSYHIDVVNQQIRSYPRKFLPNNTKKQNKNIELLSQTRKLREVREAPKIQQPQIKKVPQIKLEILPEQQMGGVGDKGKSGTKTTDIPGLGNENNFNVTLGNMEYMNQMNMMWPYHFPNYPFQYQYESPNQDRPN